MNDGENMSKDLKTLSPGDTCYIDGQWECEYIADLGFGYHAVAPEAQDVGDGWSPPVEHAPIVTRTVSPIPIAQKRANDMDNLRAELEQVRAEIRAAQAEKAVAMSERDAAYENLPALKRAAGIASGEYPWVVTSSAPYLHEWSDFLNKDSDGRKQRKPVRLLSLMGDSGGDWLWKVNRYRDDSGDWVELRVFKDHDEALAEAAGELRKRLDNPHGAAHVECIFDKAHKDVRDVVGSELQALKQNSAKMQADRIRKTIKHHEDLLEKALGGAA